MCNPYCVSAVEMYTMQVHFPLNCDALKACSWLAMPSDPHYRSHKADRRSGECWPYRKLPSVFATAVMLSAKDGGCTKLASWGHDETKCNIVRNQAWPRHLVSYQCHMAHLCIPGGRCSIALLGRPLHHAHLKRKARNQSTAQYPHGN